MLLRWDSTWLVVKYHQDIYVEKGFRESGCNSCTTVPKTILQAQIWVYFGLLGANMHK